MKQQQQTDPPTTTAVVGDCRLIPLPPQRRYAALLGPVLQQADQEFYRKIFNGADPRSLRQTLLLRYRPQSRRPLQPITEVPIDITAPGSNSTLRR